MSAHTPCNENTFDMCNLPDHFFGLSIFRISCDPMMGIIDLSIILCQWSTAIMNAESSLSSSSLSSGMIGWIMTKLHSQSQELSKLTVVV